MRKFDARKGELMNKAGIKEFCKWSVLATVLPALLSGFYVLLVSLVDGFRILLIPVGVAAFYIIFKCMANGYWAMLKTRKHVGGKTRALKALATILLGMIASALILLPLGIINLTFSNNWFISLIYQAITFFVGFVVAINTTARYLYTGKISLFASPKRVKAIFGQIDNKVIIKYYVIVVLSAVALIFFIPFMVAMVLSGSLIGLFLLGLSGIMVYVSIVSWAQAILFSESEKVFFN